jgi:transcriptional regulator with XRE-family HTH domain
MDTTGAIVRWNIRRLREERRLTYAEVSRQLDGYNWPIPVLGLRRIERGERRVDVDDLTLLARVLGVAPAALLRPPTDCGVCHGTPPSGFACRLCG